MPLSRTFLLKRGVPLFVLSLAAIRQGYHQNHFDHWWARGPNRPTGCLSCSLQREHSENRVTETQLVLMCTLQHGDPGTPIHPLRPGAFLLPTWLSRIALNSASSLGASHKQKEGGGRRGQAWRSPVRLPCPRGYSSRGTPEARSRLCVCQASFLMTFAMGGVPHSGPQQ